MDAHGVRRLRLALQFVSVVAIIGVGAVVVWFGIAAAEASAAHMAAAGATFGAVASGWAGGFAAVKARLKSAESAEA